MKSDSIRSSLRLPGLVRDEVGYDRSLFYIRDVEYKGSCGYEAISDQLYNDRGESWQRVRSVLLATMKALPWRERQVFAVAIFGSTNVNRFQDDAIVCHCYVCAHVLTLRQWTTAVDTKYGPREAWMDHPMLAMVPKALPDARLVVHKARCPPVDDTPKRLKVVRLLNVPGHFVSLRPRSELPHGQLAW